MLLRKSSLPLSSASFGSAAITIHNSTYSRRVVSYGTNLGEMCSGPLAAVSSTFSRPSTLATAVASPRSTWHLLEARPTTSRGPPMVPSKPQLFLPASKNKRTSRFSTTVRALMSRSRHMWWTESEVMMGTPNLGQCSVLLADARDLGGER